DPPVLKPYIAHPLENLGWRDVIRAEAAPIHPGLRAWRERQINRCLLELGNDQNQKITHIPAAFELTRGCSVNCWFCAFEAGPLSGIFRHTPQNAALWRDVQQVMGEVLGPMSAGRGSCYWATEPLDNPDLEAFLQDFYGMHGQYPQITTAVPVRDAGRMRRLLAESYRKGCLINRFSVHSGEILLAIHRAFSDEELAYTELLLENDEAVMSFSRSGKLFNLEVRDPEKARHEDGRIIQAVMRQAPALKSYADKIWINHDLVAAGEPPAQGSLRINVPGTTACVSGFLVNMVDRTVELISPCACCDEWPKGYIVFARESFLDARDFRETLGRVLARWAPEHLLPEDIVRFNQRFAVRKSETGFAVGTVFGSVRYENGQRIPYLHHLGDLLSKGGLSAGYIALEAFYLFGHPEEGTLDLIRDMFARGLLSV
ncbi:MAG: radical SAM family RiPP maturation amino acid epimerase, partial [Planctomycetes bacterium]|nr:radical SAM family RiPP maturation amino acid epimerase [Planctomycetota bacterium]